MKYIINYMLFMAVCAVVSVCFRYVTASPNGKGSVVSDPTITNYWGIQAFLSPGGMIHTGQKEETTINASTYPKQNSRLALNYSYLNTSSRITHYNNNNLVVRATTLSDDTEVLFQAALFYSIR